MASLLQLTDKARPIENRADATDRSYFKKEVSHSWTDSDHIKEFNIREVWLLNRYSLYRYPLTNCPIADSLRLPLPNHTGMLARPPQ